MKINRKSVDFNIKAAWLAISKMYNALGTDHGVTHSIGFVLLNIDKETGTPATKIAPLMGMEARSLTRMLKSMEEEGVIIRKSDEEDKRKVMICLTDEGKRKREIARQAVREFNRRVREAIPEDKLTTFFEVIEAIYSMAEDIRANETVSTIIKNEEKKPTATPEPRKEQSNDVLDFEV